MDFLRILDVIYKEFLNFWPFLLILSYKRLSYKKKAYALLAQNYEIKVTLITIQVLWFLEIFVCGFKVFGEIMCGFAVSGTSLTSLFGGGDVDLWTFEGIMVGLSGKIESFLFYYK